MKRNAIKDKKFGTRESNSELFADRFQKNTYFTLLKDQYKKITKKY